MINWKIEYSTILEDHRVRGSIKVMNETMSDSAARQYAFLDLESDYEKIYLRMDFDVSDIEVKFERIDECPTCDRD